MKQNDNAWNPQKPVGNILMMSYLLPKQSHKVSILKQVCFLYYRLICNDSINDTNLQVFMQVIQVIYAVGCVRVRKTQFRAETVVFLLRLNLYY